MSRLLFRASLGFFIQGVLVYCRHWKLEGCGDLNIVILNVKEKQGSIKHAKS